MTRNFHHTFSVTVTHYINWYRPSIIDTGSAIKKIGLGPQLLNPVCRETFFEGLGGGGGKIINKPLNWALNWVPYHHSFCRAMISQLEFRIAYKILFSSKSKRRSSYFWHDHDKDPFKRCSLNILLCCVSWPNPGCPSRAVTWDQSLSTLHPG